MEKDLNIKRKARRILSLILVIMMVVPFSIFELGTGSSAANHSIYYSNSERITNGSNSDGDSTWNSYWKVYHNLASPDTRMAVYGNYTGNVRVLDAVGSWGTNYSMYNHASGVSNYTGKIKPGGNDITFTLNNVTSDTELCLAYSSAAIEACPVYDLATPLTCEGGYYPRMKNSKSGISVLLELGSISGTTIAVRHIYITVLGSNGVPKKQYHYDNPSVSLNTGTTENTIGFDTSGQLKINSTTLTSAAISMHYFGGAWDGALMYTTCAPGSNLLSQFFLRENTASTGVHVWGAKSSTIDWNNPLSGYYFYTGQSNGFSNYDDTSQGTIDWNNDESCNVTFNRPENVNATYPSGVVVGTSFGALNNVVHATYKNMTLVTQTPATQTSALMDTEYYVSFGMTSLYSNKRLDYTIKKVGNTPAINFGKSFSLSVQTNNGTPSGSLPATSYNYGDTINFPVMQKTGYQFHGWTLTFNDVTTRTETEIAKTSAETKTYNRVSDATATAVFTAETYTIPLNDNGGSGGSTSVSVSYDATSVGSFTAPTRTDYSFDGYYTAASGGDKVIDASGNLCNVSGYTTNGKWSRTTSCPTLYAHWVQEDKIIFYLNGGSFGNAFSNGDIISDPNVDGYTAKVYDDSNGKRIEITGYTPNDTQIKLPLVNLSTESSNKAYAYQDGYTSIYGWSESVADADIGTIATVTVNNVTQELVAENASSPNSPVLRKFPAGPHYYYAAWRTVVAVDPGDGSVNSGYATDGKYLFGLFKKDPSTAAPYTEWSDSHKYTFDTNNYTTTYQISTPANIDQFLGFFAENGSNAIASINPRKNFAGNLIRETENIVVYAHWSYRGTNVLISAGNFGNGVISEKLVPSNSTLSLVVGNDQTTGGTTTWNENTTVINSIAATYKDGNGNGIGRNGYSDDFYFLGWNTSADGTGEWIKTLVDVNGVVHANTASGTVLSKYNGTYIAYAMWGLPVVWNANGGTFDSNYGSGATVKTWTYPGTGTEENSTPTVLNGKTYTYKQSFIDSGYPGYPSDQNLIAPKNGYKAKYVSGGYFVLANNNVVNGTPYYGTSITFESGTQHYTVKGRNSQHDYANTPGGILELFVIWEPKITYHANNGTSDTFVETAEYKWNQYNQNQNTVFKTVNGIDYFNPYFQECKAAANTFSKSGYTFLGLAKTPERAAQGTVDYSVGATIFNAGYAYYDSIDYDTVLNANGAKPTDLYAVWQQDNVTVNFAVYSESYGYGSVSPSSVSVAPGTSISVNSNSLTIGGNTVTATPTASDAQYTYTFDKWVDVNGNQFTSGTAAAGLTIYAKFTITTNTYTVTWKNYNGDTLEYDTGVAYGSVPEYNNSTVPSRASTAQYNYVFTGWSYTNVDSNGKVIGNVVATPRFREDTRVYNVIFYDENGTTVLHSYTAEYGATVGNSPSPTKSSDNYYNYNFTGWTPALTEQTTVSGDMTFTAVYSSSPRTYQIGFELNYTVTDGILNGIEITKAGFGTQVVVDEYTYNPSGSIQLPTPECRGCKFLGWYDNSDYNGNPVTSFSTNTYGDKTFYAKWDPSTLFLNGKAYTLEHDAKTYTKAGKYDEPVRAGETVTITYTGNDQFVCWVNGNNKILSTSASFNYTLYNLTSIKAIAGRQDDTQTSYKYVIYKAYDEYVMKSELVDPSKGVTALPNTDIVPNRAGFKCTGWDKDTSEILTELGSADYVIVTATYENINNTYTVNFIDGKTNSVSKKLGEACAFEATGANFSYWEDTNTHTVVSYNKKLNVRKFYAQTYSYTAVYNASGYEPVGVMTVPEPYTNPTLINNKARVSFTSSLSVPDGATVVEMGMIYSGKAAVSSTETLMLNKSGVYKYTSEQQFPTGTVTLNVSTSAQTGTFYVRGYVMYTMPGSSEVQTKYSTGTCTFCDPARNDGICQYTFTKPSN